MFVRNNKMKPYLRVGTVVAAVLTAVSILSAQHLSSTVKLKLNGGQSQDIMTFGVHVNATYGIDSALGEAEGPPEAPPGQVFFDAWEDPRAMGGLGYGGSVTFGLFEKDLRKWYDTTQIDTFELFCQPDSGFHVKIYWPSAALLSDSGGIDSMYIMDAATGGALVYVNMFSVDSLVVPNTRSGQPIKEFDIIRYGARLVGGIQPQLNNAAVPRGFALHQNYPNPFNPTTTISFAIARSSVAEIAVYDVLGRQVSTLVAGQLNPGTYTTQWNGTDSRGFAMGSGVYFVRMTARANGVSSNEEFSAVRKLLLMK